MKKTKVILSVLFILLFSRFVMADIINVPADQPTIQQGLNVATEGDTVLVAPSTYYENLFWPATNGITLLSETGAENTIIDGSNSSAVIYTFGTTIDTTTVINGFTLQNGTADSGGGISCLDASPLVKNCIIENNEGGGCAFTNSFAVLKNNEIRENNGNGIKCEECSNITTEYCNIENNNGSGIYLFSTSSGDIIECDITGNSTDHGGGIYCNESSPSLENVIITNNSALDGGGIYCSGSSPSLSKVTITLNSANLGGAIYCTNSNSTIENCTITENSASEEGDGIYTENSSEPTIHNSNILLNGYGIFNNDPSVMLAADNNYWGDETGPYHEFWNPSGLGDSVNQFVNPIPFLTEADITAPPIPPFGLDTLAVGLDYFTIIWQNSPIGDLAGYKVYFDSDSTGFPYSDTVDVGIDTTYTITNLITGTTYYIAVTCYDNSGEESWYSNEIEVTPGGVNIDDNTLHLPKSFYLSQNYPNPFNPETTISFSIPKYSKVEISIYNIKGQKVKTIAKKDFEKGIHKVIWNGKDIAGKSVSSGIYFYKMETGNFSEIKKAILLK